jgi:putative phosphoesterase
MISSIAILSDIHGILPALDAVLAEPDVIAADRIVLPGDIAAGPQPIAVLDRLLRLGDRAIWVRGNADREMADVARGRIASSGDPISDWAASQLPDRYVTILDSLPHPLLISVAGFGDVLICHGTPRDENEIVLVDTGMERWEEVLRDVPVSVSTIVCGHTHIPFVRLAHGRTIVNPGSIGLPYGLSGAHWAMLRDGSITLRRTIYDVQAACDAIVSGSTFPDVRQWVNESLRVTPSDAEALAVFGPLAGRAGAAPST